MCRQERCGYISSQRMAGISRFSVGWGVWRGVGGRGGVGGGGAANFIYKQTTERFSDVMWTMQQILFMSFDRRLAVFLIDESAKTGKDTLTMTHDQIAKYTGSAREVVSRMLKYFENEGMVELGRGRVRLKDKKRLKELARQ